jgi:hypothetical protein
MFEKGSKIEKENGNIMKGKLVQGALCACMELTQSNAIILLYGSSKLNQSDLKNKKKVSELNIQHNHWSWNCKHFVGAHCNLLDHLKKDFF